MKAFAREPSILCRCGGRYLKGLTPHPPRVMLDFNATKGIEMTNEERWLVKVVYWTGIESIKGIYDTRTEAEEVALEYRTDPQAYNYFVEKFNQNIHWLAITGEKK